MWSAKHNKYYRGRMDRMAVSVTESYEVDDFIDQFLRVNNIPDMDTNRERIASAMTQYPARAPWRQDEVATFVRQKMNI
jgi:hypothetical protein